MSRRDDHSWFDGDPHEAGDPFGHDTVDAQITARLQPGAAQDADTALVRSLATAYALPHEAEPALDRVRATLPARLTVEQPEGSGTQAPRGWPARLASEGGAHPPDRRGSPLTMFLRAAAAVALLAVLGGGFFAVFSLRGGGRPTGPTPTPAPCPTTPGRVGLWRDASITADKTHGVSLNFDLNQGVTYAVSDASGMIFAAGGGHLWYSMDGVSYCLFTPDLPPLAAGQAWAIATVPGGPGVFASPMAAGANITAVGAHYGPVLYATLGDSGWQQLQGPVINTQLEFPTPSASGADPVAVWRAIFLRDLMFEYPTVQMAQGRLFVVGSSGLITTPDMSGKAWALLDNPGGGCSRFAVNPNNGQQVFCQGSTGGAISETSDGGQTWQVLPPGPGLGGTTLVGASASAVCAYVEDAVESTGVSCYALAGGKWQKATHLLGSSVIDVSPSDTVYSKDSVNGTHDVQVQFFSLAPGAGAFEPTADQASLPISGENVVYGMGGIWPGQEPAAYAWEASYRAGGTTQPLYRLALPQQAPPPATAVPSATATATATAAPTASVAPAPAPAPFTPTGVTPLVNGVLYVTTNNGYVFALDAATGHVVWRFHADAVAGYPNVANGVVYFGAQDPPSGGPTPSPSYLFALNASTGTLIWKVSTRKPTGPEVILNGVLYGGTYENDVYAFRASDGHLLWTYGTGGCYTAPMATDGTNLYVNTVACAGIIALHTNGTLAWRGDFVGDGTPVVVNGVLYDGPCAFRTSSGSQLWCFHTDQGSTNFTDIVSGGVDYVSTSTSLYAVNASSGAVIWHVPTQHMQWLQGVVGTTIYTSGSDGYDPNLHALQASDGSPRWTAPVLPAEGTLQSGSGVIYVGSTAGAMYALNPADGAVVWKTALQ